MSTCRRWSSSRRSRPAADADPEPAPGSPCPRGGVLAGRLGCQLLSCRLLVAGCWGVDCWTTSCWVAACWASAAKLPTAGLPVAGVSDAELPAGIAGCWVAGRWVAADRASVLDGRCFDADRIGRAAVDGAAGRFLPRQRIRGTARFSARLLRVRSGPERALHRRDRGASADLLAAATKRAVLFGSASSRCCGRPCAPTPLGSGEATRPERRRHRGSSCPRTRPCHHP